MAEPILGPLGIDFAAIDAVQQHPLGMEVQCVDGCIRRYIRAGATILAHQFLKTDTAEGVNDLTPTTALKDVIEAVAEVAITDNYFGWVVVEGNVVGLMENGAALLDRQGSSNTLGSVTKTIVTGGGVTAAEAERILSAAQGKGVICVVAPVGAAVYGTVRIC